ncbi:ThiF family adenylyltransferase [Terrabacter sp. MAHUQ-38]|uniref:ThiF family adenylyltransferase n=1 Tax=unclassified Terrabacter TaxID=2630222 RepID=UPI00165D65FC|nr:ThiF family adenylyltransferase [Terrabacter sp. MAHUQ-38]MBC9820102.1 ThiF family adenylyltransferase [Terrabacter sp. MAHUQ-38]
MTATHHRDLSQHLLRVDGQEDICLATYAPSTGKSRTSRVITGIELPLDGERQVHGNASLTGAYVLRVATQAARDGRGVVMMHSHPRGRGWQRMSSPDADAESSFAGLVQQVTGLPLVGMTLAGDESWSARVWIDGNAGWAESVRRVGQTLVTSWNDDLVSSLADAATQARTISAWGERLHRDITRLRVLVVGVGSVGLDVVQRLAATGLLEIGVMDFDRIETHNRDRMIGATRRDVRLRRRKVDIAARLARQAATAETFTVTRHHDSICSPTGMSDALDYDMIFSCVDRPWPRAALNTLAYADLIPVIDGGIAIDTFATGGMRGATRRVQTATPGVPCLACTGQIDMTEVALEMSGDLDDPEYIRRAGRNPVSGRPNVAALCAGVSSSQLEQFVALVAHPAGCGVPGAQRFSLALHRLERLPHQTQPYCTTESQGPIGDGRIDLRRASGPWSDQNRVRTLRRWFDNLIDRRLESIANTGIESSPPVHLQRQPGRRRGPLPHFRQTPSTWAVTKVDDVSSHASCIKGA